jgi:hypothetical protein
MTHVTKGLRLGQKIQLAARFSPSTFEEIRALAAKRKTSVAEQIRVLVEIGLDVEAIGAEWEADDMKKENAK